MKVLKVERITKRIVRTPTGIEVYSDYIEIQRCDEGQLHEVILQEDHKDLFIPTAALPDNNCMITISNNALDDIIAMINKELQNDSNTIHYTEE